MMFGPTEAWYANLAMELEAGRLTPFLGAGVNMLGAERRAFKPGERLPNADELATYLAERRRYDAPGEQRPELIKVAQWVYSHLGSAALYDDLHRVFDHDFAPTPVHDLLAEMPEFIRRRDGMGFPLVISTNYDDALERAFEARGEAFDVLTYEASGKHTGLFLHTDAQGKNVLVKVGKTYQGINLRERPVILKMHGAVRREDTPVNQDSYVVTEDDYIESLAGDVLARLPHPVKARMQACHYLFLGYSLRDWNLRAMLHRIWKEHVRENKSWAVEKSPAEDDLKAWQARDVEIFTLDLADFAEALRQELTGGAELVG
jgi:hypothetical protein